MLADDITGACDTGMQFAKQGLATEVVLEGKPRSSDAADMAVHVTNTRSASAAAVAARIRQACGIIQEQNLMLV